jgi:hypothetical protein
MTAAACHLAPDDFPDLRLFGSEADGPCPISDDQRRAAVEALTEHALHAPQERDRVAAAPALVAMDRHNLQWERLRAGQEEASRPYRPCNLGQPT